MIIINLNALEAVARAAGGQEWEDTGNEIREAGAACSTIWWHDFEGDVKLEHRAHVAAANPAVVISLVQMLRKAQAENTALQEEIARLRKINSDMGWQLNHDRMGS